LLLATPKDGSNKKIVSFIFSPQIGGVLGSYGIPECTEEIKPIALFSPFIAGSSLIIRIYYFFCD
jgi:hypothetical protein